jgi:hypothetical protein
MAKLVGLMLVVLGVLFSIRSVSGNWILLLLGAGALVYGAASGVIGRWGYVGGGLLALLVAPVLLFKSLALLLKLLPYLLVLYGIYLLLRTTQR